MNPFVKLLLLLSLNIGNTTLATPSLPPKGMEILQTVLHPNGHLDKQMHKEFWQAMPPQISSDPDALSEFSAFVQGLVLPGSKWQQAVWQSVKLSYESGRPVYIEGYEEAYQNLLQRSGDLDIASVKRSAESLIRAAASGQPVKGPQGPFYVTEALIRQVLSGLDGVFSRVDRLLSIEWSAELKEFHFADLSIALLAVDPPYRENIEMLDLNGNTFSAHQLQINIDLPNSLSILSFNPKSRFDKPVQQLSNIAYSSMETGAFNVVHKHAEMWRGHLSVLVSGVDRASHPHAFIESRFVYVEARNQVVGLLSLSMESQFRASSNLSQSDHRFRLIQ